MMPLDPKSVPHQLLIMKISAISWHWENSTLQDLMGVLLKNDTMPAKDRHQPWQHRIMNQICNILVNIAPFLSEISVTILILIHLQCCPQISKRWKSTEILLPKEHGYNFWFTWNGPKIQVSGNICTNFVISANHNKHYIIMQAWCYKRPKNYWVLNPKPSQTWISGLSKKFKVNGNLSPYIAPFHKHKWAWCSLSWHTHDATLRSSRDQNFQSPTSQSTSIWTRQQK